MTNEKRKIRCTSSLRMNTNARKYVFVFILLIGAVAYTGWVRYNQSRLQYSEINKLPRIDVSDIQGRAIKARNFSGRPVFVQFIKNNSRTAIMLLLDLLVEWEESSLAFMVLTNKPEELDTNITNNPRLNIIGVNHYESLRAAFHAPESGSYYLFSSSGSLIVTGRDYVDAAKDLKRHLNYLLYGKAFSIQELIPSNIRSDRNDGLAQLGRLVETAAGRYIVIAMFTSICSGCRSGEIIRNLLKLEESQQGLISITCILGGSLSESDARNAKSQLHLPFPVIEASHDLRLRWDRLIASYSESELTDVVFILDKQGTVLDVAYPNCPNCWSPFYGRLDNLGTEDKYDKNSQLF